MQRRKQKKVKQQQTLDVPPDKLAEYKESFDYFDKDKGGTISANELYKLMKSTGMPISLEEVQEMIARVDSSGDGQVDFDEFVCLMKEIEVEEPDEDPIIKAFRFFDKENTGKISNQEFKYIITHIGEDLFNNSEANLLFKESNLEPEGEFDYAEFVKYWRSK